VKAHSIALCMAFLGLTCNIMCANSSAPTEEAQGFWLNESTWVVEYQSADTMAFNQTTSLDISSECVHTQINGMCSYTAHTAECARVGD